MSGPAHERAVAAIRTFPFWDYNGMETADPFSPASSWASDLAGAVLRAVAPELGRSVARLAAAERVCGLYGITVHPSGTEKEQACLQAWMDWSALCGLDRPLVPEQEISELAQRRAAATTETLARIRK